MEHGGTRHVALDEPDAFAVLEINGGKEDHESVRTERRESSRSGEFQTRSCKGPANHQGCHCRKFAIRRSPSR
jgi:hypothetical protein